MRLAGLGILTNLQQVRPHRFARLFGIASLYRIENALVVVLSPVRPTFHLKNPHTLFAQQSNN